MLDVGCADGALFERFGGRISGGIGIDPDATPATPRANVRIMRGWFPADVPDERFDVITMLAVVEHLPESAYADTGTAVARHLRPGGRLVITVPEPAVDRIVHLLGRVRLVDGMALHEHHGFATEEVARIFEPHGLRLVAHRRFQLGLNNLFVFEPRPDEG